MPNQLQMALSDAILTLHRRGWSQRRIARELGIDRETVARHIAQALPASKPANAPLGTDPEAPAPKPAHAPLGAEPTTDLPFPAAQAAPADGTERPSSIGPSAPVGRPSECAPWREVLLAKLELGLTAQRIYQDLVSEHGFRGSYFSVRRFVKRLGEKSPLPFRRLECGPGEEAQVDFGTGALIRGSDGRGRRPHVFRIVLSHSRKAYSEVVYRQTTENFIRCLENAFWSFGGVPQRLVLDNLKAAVREPDWFDPELNPKVRSFCQHYGIVPLPTRPRTPRHKGKIERGIGYVKDNALKGRTFSSLEEANRFLLDWEASVADTRRHGTTRQQVGKRFAEVERPALQPLPVERFPFFHEARRVVHRDGHVEVERAFYSVPPEYLGRQVWVRWDSRLVRVCNERMEQIALHIKHESGRFSTQAQHLADAKISGIERGAAWLLNRVRLLGPQSAGWAEAMIAVRGIEGVRVLQGLLSLASKHPVALLERACAVAHSHGEYRLRTLRALMGRQAPEQQQFELIDTHPLIRSLADYEQLVQTSFRKERPV